MNARIVCAAMLMDDGNVVTGVRHYDPDMRAIMRKAYGTGYKLWGRWIIKPYHMRVKAQGFMDAKRVFLYREDAWVRAQETGQIIHEVGTEGTLYSENLY